MRSCFATPLAVLCLAACASLTAAALLPAQHSAMHDLCAAFGTRVGWNCDEAPCHWSGVSCDALGTSVSKITIPYKARAGALQVAIPSGVLALSDLIEHNFEQLGVDTSAVDGLVLQNKARLTRREAELLLDGPAVPTVPSEPAPAPAPESEPSSTPTTPSATPTGPAATPTTPAPSPTTPEATPSAPAPSPSAASDHAPTGAAPESSSPSAPDAPSIAPSRAPEDGSPSTPEPAASTPQGAPDAPAAPTAPSTPTSVPSSAPEPASASPDAPEAPTAPGTPSTPTSVPSSAQEPATASPSNGTAPSNVTATVYPIAHCWTSINSTIYAYFGYEATEAWQTSGRVYNVSGGVEATASINDFAAGRHLLTFAIEATSEVVVLSFANQHVVASPQAPTPVSAPFNETEPSSPTEASPAAPSAPVASPQAVISSAYVQSLNTSDTSLMCPNITLKFVLSYPSASNFANLSDHVHELLSDLLPYPFELIETTNADEGMAKRDAMSGNVAVAMNPGADHNPFYSYTTGIGNNAPPSDATTGQPGASPQVTSTIPSSGGAPSPASNPINDVPPPPGLNKFAKGAIAICVILGVIIVTLVIILAIIRRSKKLPTTSREHQNKSVRRLKKADIEDGMSVPLAEAEAADEDWNDEEVSDEENDKEEEEDSEEEASEAEESSKSEGDEDEDEESSKGEHSSESEKRSSSSSPAN